MLFTTRQTHTELHQTINITNQRDLSGSTYSICLIPISQNYFFHAYRRLLPPPFNFLHDYITLSFIKVLGFCKKKLMFRVWVFITDKNVLVNFHFDFYFLSCKPNSELPKISLLRCSIRNLIEITWWHCRSIPQLEPINKCRD